MASELHEIAKRGDVAELLQLLQAEIPLNMHDEDDGVTAFMHAAAAGHLQAVQALVVHGAIVDAKDHNSWTALMWALKNRHFQVARYLDDQRAAVDCSRKDCTKSAKYACSNCYQRRYCSSDCQHVDWIAGHQKQCRKPLVQPAKPRSSNNKIKLKIRSKKKQSVSSGDSADSEVSVLEAVCNNDLAAVSRLRPDNLGQLYEGYSLVHWAAYVNEETNVLRYLIELGADLFNVDNEHGYTPLHSAASNGKLKAVKCLVEASPDLLIVKDKDGNTPLHRAVQYGHLSVVRHLVQCRAPLNALNAGGQTPRQAAPSGDPQFDVVRRLLDCVQRQLAEEEMQADARVPFNNLARCPPRIRQHVGDRVFVCLWGGVFYPVRVATVRERNVFLLGQNGGKDVCIVYFGDGDDPNRLEWVKYDTLRPWPKNVARFSFGTEKLPSDQRAKFHVRVEAAREFLRSAKKPNATGDKGKEDEHSPVGQDRGAKGERAVKADDKGKEEEEHLMGGGGGEGSEHVFEPGEQFVPLHRLSYVHALQPIDDSLLFDDGPLPDLEKDYDGDSQKSTEIVSSQEYDSTEEEDLLPEILLSSKIRIKMPAKGQPKSKSLVLKGYQEEGVQRVLQGLNEDVFFAKLPKKSEKQQKWKYEQRRTRCFLLADEMGMGKTIQALEVLRRLKVDQQLIDRPVLVCAPMGCLDGWKREIDTYFCQHFHTVQLTRSDLTVNNLEAMTPSTIALTTYQTLSSAFGVFVRERRTQMSGAELKRLLQCDNQRLPKGILAGTNLEDPDVKAQLLQAVEDRLHKITSTSTTKADSVAARVAFMQTQFSVLVLDEIQHVKNAQSKASTAVAWIRCERRLGLSGTPIMNHGKEMTSVLRFGLGLADVHWDLINRQPDGPYCNRLLATVMLSRQKSDIVELRALLPERDMDSEKLRVQWTDAGAEKTYRMFREHAVEQWRHYQSLEQGEDESNRDFRTRRMAAQSLFWAEITRLRQVCLHPDLPFLAQETKVKSKEQLHTVIMKQDWPRWSPRTHMQFPRHHQHRIETVLLSLRRLFPTETCRDIRHLICANLSMAERNLIQPSAKMLQFLEIYRARRALYPDSKVVMVSFYRSFLEHVVGPWLTRRGIGSILYGGDSQARKAEALRAFENDPEISVLLLSKMAGGQGLNLQHASATLVIMEPHFNDAQDEQAAARVLRVGQERAVSISKLFMIGSVDEALRMMQEGKRLVVEGWLGRGEKKSMDSFGLYLEKYDTVGKGVPHGEYKNYLLERNAPTNNNNSSSSSSTGVSSSSASDDSLSSASSANPSSSTSLWGIFNSSSSGKF